jgi:hypothetical protein
MLRRTISALLCMLLSALRPRDGLPSPLAKPLHRLCRRDGCDRFVRTSILERPVLAYNIPPPAGFADGTRGAAPPHRAAVAAVWKEKGSLGSEPHTKGSCSRPAAANTSSRTKRKSMEISSPGCFRLSSAFMNGGYCRRFRRAPLGRASPNGRSLSHLRAPPAPAPSERTRAVGQAHLRRERIVLARVQHDKPQSPHAFDRGAELVDRHRFEADVAIYLGLRIHRCEPVDSAHFEPVAGEIDDGPVGRFRVRCGGPQGGGRAEACPCGTRVRRVPPPKPLRRGPHS